MDLTFCNRQMNVSCSQSSEQHYRDFFQVRYLDYERRIIFKNLVNTFSQHPNKNNDTENYEECSSALMLFQIHIYATNERFVHMHIFEYSRMNRRNSFSTAFLASVRWKNLVC